MAACSNYGYVLEQLQTVGLPQDLGERLEFARLHVPFQKSPQVPQLGSGADQPQGRDQRQGDILEDELLYSTERVEIENIIEQEVAEVVGRVGKGKVEHLQIEAVAEEIFEDFFAEAVNLNV